MRLFVVYLYLLSFNYCSSAVFCNVRCKIQNANKAVKEITTFSKNFDDFLEGHCNDFGIVCDYF